MATGIGYEYGTGPLPEIRAGKTGDVETLTAGGVAAYGEIVFADNPTADDTITINGTVFTFVASGATGNQINISGVNLPGTLTNMGTVLNASVVAGVALATYDNDATDTLTITYDTYAVAGNDFTLAASADTPSGATLTGGQDAVSVSIATEPTKFSLTQDVNQNFGLADGDEAQKKLLYMSLMSGTGTALVTPTNLTGGTTITFDAITDYAELRFIAGSWVKVAGTAGVA